MHTAQFEEQNSDSPFNTMSFLSKPFNKYKTLLSSLFRSTPAAKQFPDDSTSTYYDELTNAAATSGDFNALRDVLNKRIQHNCLNTKRTFNFITNETFSPSLLNDLLQTLSTLNHGVTRKTAFDSLVIRLCKLNRVDDALHVIEYMARDDAGCCRPSATTFYPVLNHLTRQKALDQARRVVDFMSKLGVKLDLTGHKYFLSAHCYAGDVAAAAGVLKKMEEDGIGADARTFDALVLGACKVKKVDGAIVLVRRMVDDGVPILYSTHMFVIGGLLRMNCYEQALSYVKGFGGKDKALDAELFRCLPSKLVGLNRFKEAVIVLEEMDQRGLPMGSKLRIFYEKNAGNEDKGEKKKKKNSS
ncbi:hypothetical protein PIB30_002536 [Stylosanthes scabra]|uniref:Pentatricopeptide repeat-containing protein-mitochondrial domain-containing protein n=1 Tax=Stylosanthes scabra TaxID=79078 RepID=A0ABU6XZW2_9FABA|nr:hypothetical protein [Stylosanthes scabra]